MNNIEKSEQKDRSTMKSTIRKIEKFKYYDECGFFITMNGYKKFIIPLTESLYVNSLFRMLKKISIVDLNGNINRPPNGIILLSNTDFQTFKTEKEFIDYLIDNYESDSNVTSITDKISDMKFNTL